jgi:hypothetical protein
MTTLSVRINEKTVEGKTVASMLKMLASKTKAISVIEEVEDKRLAKLIIQGKESGMANTKTVLKKLDL